LDKFSRALVGSGPGFTTGTPKKVPVFLMAKYFSMRNPIFCTAPFTTLRVESDYKTNQIGFKPGCVYKIQTKSESLDDFLHGEEMSTLRDNKLNGIEPVPGCNACSKNDKLGVESIRKQLLQKPWASDKLGIKLLDIFFSNTCNLGCYMCAGTYSTYLANERNNAGLSDTPVVIEDNTNLVLTTIDQLPDLESVSFIGGEFFIFKKNLIILDKIIQRQLGCRIVTNASIIPPSSLNRLKQISDLEVSISVDGVKDAYNFMRYPATWEQFSTNVDTLKKELPNSSMYFRFIIQILNISHVYETLDWANKQLMPIQVSSLTSSDSQGLNWSILREHEKDKLIEFLQTEKSKYRITTKQNATIDKYALGIQKSIFNQNHRDAGIKLISTLTAHRKLDMSIVRSQLGVLTELADEIEQARLAFSPKTVYTIQDETMHNTNPR
jgi:organic radical activating enzyme